MSLLRTNYAGELAVLSTWLAVVLPWNFVYYDSIGPAGESTLISFRSAFVELQFIQPANLVANGQSLDVGGAIAEVLGSVKLVGPLHVTAPPLAMDTFANDRWIASLTWTLGAAVLLVALFLSVAYYLDTEAVEESLTWSPVRILGALLAIATALLGVSTVYYYLGRSLTGFPIPAGLVVMGALAVLLLVVESEADDAVTDGPEDDTISSP